MLPLVIQFLVLVLQHQIGLSNAAAPAIKQGQTLKDGETLSSATGVFQLTFYTAKSGKGRYLAILPVIGNISYEPVWIANRDAEISTNTGVLSLDRDGVLKLDGGNDGSIVLYSPNPDQSARARRNDSAVTAMMFDNGNFVLVEVEVSTGTYKQLWWQSFDHPTDTLLAGMRLSLNNQTGESRGLTSWVSDNVPNSGAFTLGINPNNTRELLILQRGVIFWRSGVWDGKNKTSLPSKWMNQTDSPYKFNYRFLPSNNSIGENYFTFTGKSNSNILVWVLRSMGELQSFQFEIDSNGGGATFRETLVECGMRDGGSTPGCQKQEKLVCSSRNAQENFERMRGRVDANYSTPLTMTGAAYVNASSSDCQNKCISNCSCVAYAMANSVDQTGCLFWSEGSRFIEDNDLDDVFYVLPEAIETKREPSRTNSTPPKKEPATKNTESIATKSKLRKRWWIYFPIVVPVVILLFLLVLKRRKIKRLAKYKEKLMGKGVGSRPSPQQLLTQLKGTTPSTHEDSEQCPDFQLFSFECILSATNDFSSSNQLGEGGFGPVYKGKLLEGQEIAVKRLSRSSGQGLKEFKNEITLIAKLQHMNLVRLLGCCIHGDERMLIYEYMPNNSLDSLIFDLAGRQMLDWRKRLMIIEGIAQGLLYLHKYSRLKIIHRDLKASNILLDADLNPKISDFGTARIFKQNESNSTKRIIGTYGYMSPEYAMDGIFSVKSDVFSFGVILLEIISGRKNTSFNIQLDSHINLIGYAWDLWQGNAVIELMDPILANASCPPDIDSFLRCTLVGLLCVQESAVDRPTMSEVVSMFANEAMTLPPPKQPAFLFGRHLVEEQTSREESENCSHNDVTISTLSVR